MLTLPSPREKKHAFNHTVHWPSRAEAKRVRCARSKRFISNVSTCQITIVRVQHPLRGSAYLRGKKHRTQASTKKRGDSTHILVQRTQVEVKNQLPRRCQAIAVLLALFTVAFSFARAPCMLPLSSRPRCALFTSSSALVWRRQTHEYSEECLKGWNAGIW